MLLAKKLLKDKSTNRQIQEICYGFYHSNHISYESLSISIYYLENLVTENYLLKYYIQIKSFSKIPLTQIVSEIKNTKINSRQIEEYPLKKQLTFQNRFADKNKKYQRPNKMRKRERESEQSQQLENHRKLKKKKMKQRDNHQSQGSLQIQINGQDFTNIKKSTKKQQLVFYNNYSPLNHYASIQKNILIQKTDRKQLNQNYLFSAQEIYHQFNQQSKDPYVCANLKLQQDAYDQRNNLHENQIDYNIEKYLFLDKTKTQTE